VTDAVLVLRKLTVLRDHVERARRRRGATLEAFRDAVDLQDAAAMSLLVAAQEAVDIAMHIAAERAWGIPGSYAEAVDLLAARGVIDAALAGALRRVIAVRNRIAHGYATVDLERLWRELPAGLEALDRFAVAIATFVGPPEPAP
jgi:uncharacterized protein YutE (UPF0331/DUF86 family)